MSCIPRYITRLFLESFAQKRVECRSRALQLAFFGAKRDTGRNSIGYGFKLSKLLRHEIWPSLGRRASFARYLNHAYDLFFEQDRRAHNLLYRDSTLIL